MKIFHPKLSLPIKITGVFIILIIVLIISSYIYITLQRYKDDQAEKLINQKFLQEATQIPELKVKKFQLWEGLGLVTADIENKGQVQFLYGTDGIPIILGIGSYNTVYECFYVDSTGKKTNYAFNAELNLSNNREKAAFSVDFSKWFPFQVLNLNDLVNKYDAITTVLANFPQKPSMIPFKDNSGQRLVVAESNPNYLLKSQHNEREIWCDLYK